MLPSFPPPPPKLYKFETLEAKLRQKALASGGREKKKFKVDVIINDSSDVISSPIRSSKTSRISSVRPIFFFFFPAADIKIFTNSSDGLVPLMLSHKNRSVVQKIIFSRSKWCRIFSLTNSRNASAAAVSPRTFCVRLVPFPVASNAFNDERGLCLGNFWIDLLKFPTDLNPSRSCPLKIKN